jgi:hypothetical protein
MEKILDKDDLAYGMEEELEKIGSNIKFKELSQEVIDAIDNGKSMILHEDGTIEINKEVEDIKELNNYCYFCDFSEVRPHQHHIIRKCDGGQDIPSNRIPLCANHHELVHRRIYLLAFNPKTGLYYLVHRETRKVTPPSDRQRAYKRKLPLSSIKYSNNITVKGDLNSKATIYVKELEKRRSIKQNKRLKKIREGVQSEKCAI